MGSVFCWVYHRRRHGLRGQGWPGTTQGPTDLLGGNVTKGEPIYWVGKVGNCDICGTDLSALPSFADCVIDRRSWMWGLVCTYCLEANGLEIAPGLGQLYVEKETRENIEGRRDAEFIINATCNTNLSLRGFS